MAMHKTNRSTTLGAKLMKLKYKWEQILTL